MRKIQRSFPIIGSALCVMILACSQLQAAPDKEQHKRNILFVFSWNKDIPWQKEIEKGFESQFRAEGESPNLYFEYIDAGRFSSASQRAIFRDYLARKYASIRLDNVVLESEPAAALIQSNPGIFGKVKILALNPSPRFKLTNKMAARVPVSVDYKTAVNGILSISKAQTVYIVGGATRSTETRAEAIKNALSDGHPGLRVVSLVGLPMQEILSRVEHAQPGSVILYLLIFQDGVGKRFVPYHAAQQISQHASAPMYSFWTPLMGSGIVGGYLLSGERVGREAAHLLSEPVRNSVRGDLSERFHGYYFDWRQLQRWDIPINRLPVNSVIMFKRPNFFHEHMVEIVVLSIIAGLAVLIFRYRELKRYNREIDSSRINLQSANNELGRVKTALEEKNEMLRKLSVTDRLTGLHNRAYMEDRLQDELDRIDRHPGDLCVIMADIDHFKQINDKYGHPVGDEVLAGISGMLQKNIRSIDEIGRWGGEEFMIICPGASKEEGGLLAEKLLQLVSSTDYGKVGRVTCSFGVTIAYAGMSRLELVKNVDEALYNSKAEGRNRVSIILPESSSISD